MTTFGLTETLEEAVARGFLITRFEEANALRDAYRGWCDTHGRPYLEVVREDPDEWSFELDPVEGQELTSAQQDAVRRLLEQVGACPQDLDETGNLSTCSIVGTGEARSLAEGLAGILGLAG